MRSGFVFCVLLHTRAAMGRLSELQQRLASVCRPMAAVALYEPAIELNEGLLLP